MGVRGKTLVQRPSGAFELLPDDIIQPLADIGLLQRFGETWVQVVELDLAALPSLAVCDFCNARPTTWNVGAGAFQLEGPAPMLSDEDWLACEPCGQLIADNDRRGLNQRALEATRRRVSGKGLPVPPFLAAQCALLSKFWQHYTGRITRLRAQPGPAPTP